MADYEELFELVKALPPCERAEYLKEACGKDEELLARVSKLLEDADKADIFFGKTTAGEPETLTEEAKIGQLIDRYTLLEKIGEGGFGAVFLAEQQAPIKRQVALKILKPGMDSVQIIHRFEAERQALAMMDHPNIARVFDAGASPLGRPFFVMELVQGVPITAFCNERNLSLSERLELFREVCAAVQHAHQKGVIHRDLKPSNILAADSGNGFEIKVIDFGIAKAIAQDLTENPLQTREGQILGTLPYMSPEQSTTGAMEVDTRSDIYSLGVVLYEILTGCLPLDRERLMQAGWDEAFRLIREEDPPKPSTRLASGTRVPSSDLATKKNEATERLDRLVKGDLDWIVMKALAKEKERRYESASSLGEDLRRHLEGEPVIAAPPGVPYRIRKYIRKHRIAVAAAAIIALSLLVATAVSIQFAIVAGQAKKAEKTRADQAVSATEKALALSEFLASLLRSPDPLRDGRTIRVIELLDRGRDLLLGEEGKAMGQNRRTVLLEALAQAYGGLGVTSEAIPLMERVRETCLRTLGREHPATIAALVQLTGYYRDAGRLHKALEMGQEAFELSADTFGRKSAETIETMNNLVTLHFDAGQFQKVLPLSSKVVELCNENHGPGRLQTLLAKHNHATALDRTGKAKDAFYLRVEVYEALDKLKGAENPHTIRAQANLSDSLLIGGQDDNAIRMKKEVLKLSQNVFGPKHLDSLDAMSRLARTLREALRRPEDLQWSQRAYDASSAALPENHPQAIGALIDLASAHYANGNIDAALKLQESALKRMAGNYPSDHPDLLMARNNWASYLIAKDRAEEAVEILEEVVKISQQVLGPESLQTAMAIENLAESYTILGRTDKAADVRSSLPARFRNEPKSN